MKGILIKKSEAKKYGVKFALLMAILRETCNNDDYTVVSIESLKEWGLTCRMQQPLVQKAKDLGLIDVKIEKGRHIKLL